MSSGTGTLDELATFARPALAPLRRRLPEIVTGLAVLLTALGALAMAGAVIDDAAIEDNRAVAQAEVLEGSTFARTLVRFTTANGTTVVPEHGLFHPRGLQVGTTVAVEYDVTEPELVRVAGRSAADATAPVLLGVLGTWAVLGPLAGWLRRRRAARAAPG